MIPGTAGLILGDMAIHEPQFPSPGLSIGITQASLAFMQCFDFGADQDHAGLVLVEEFIIVRGGAILSDNFDRRSVFLSRGLRRRLHRAYDIRRRAGYASRAAHWRGHREVLHRAGSPQVSSNRPCRTAKTRVSHENTARLAGSGP